MNVKTAIVPVAGLGTRLLPISAATPKELLPLGKFPTLHLIAEELGRAGIERVILVSSESKSQIEQYFQPDPALEARLAASGKQEFLDLLWSQSPFAHIQFETVIQHEQKGLGHAVLCAAERVRGESVVVALGDCVMGLGGQSAILSRLVSHFHDRNASVCIGFERVPQEKVSRYGIAAPTSPPDEEGVFGIADLIEKPSIEEAPSRFAIAARYVLGPEIFDILADTGTGTGGEIQLTDAIRKLIHQRGNAYGILLEDPRFDVGNLNSYIDAFIQFAAADPELRPTLITAIQDLNLVTNPS